MKPAHRAIVLYLHVHQPYRVRPYSVFDAGYLHDYFDEPDQDARHNNRQVLIKVAESSYLPTNAILLELLNQHPDFALSLSITGTVLEQMRDWHPQALESFAALVRTGRVELVAETYYHSLAFFYSRFEFEKQVRMHQELLLELFGVRPRVFRNTELMYNNDLAFWADRAGYRGILAEGWDPILAWRSPNYVYKPAYTDNIRLLMKNYRLSDDLAFRFSNKQWQQWPLTAEKYAGWINSLDPAQTNVNLFMDYETFGEHQWAQSGILDFLKHFPEEFLKKPGNSFMTLSQAIEAFDPVDSVDTPYTTTWADSERDMSAWTGNALQQESLRLLYGLEERVLLSGDHALIKDWRRLQTSDHVYYMCTKWFRDGDVHAYFSPYDSPYDAFIYFSNVLKDIELRLRQHETKNLNGGD